MPWHTSNAKSLLPPPFAKCCMWSVKMLVQALRIEWQPDPESLRRIRRYGPNRARSEVVHCPGVKNRSNRSHRISRVVHNHFCRHQETGKHKTAYLASGGRLMFPTGELFRYPHSRVTSEACISPRWHLGVSIARLPCPVFRTAPDASPSHTPGSRKSQWDSQGFLSIPICQEAPGGA
jgi:hypothetical protein